MCYKNFSTNQLATDPFRAPELTTIYLYIPRPARPSFRGPPPLSSLSLPPLRVEGTQPPPAHA